MIFNIIAITAFTLLIITNCVASHYYKKQKDAIEIQNKLLKDIVDTENKSREVDQAQCKFENQEAEEMVESSLKSCCNNCNNADIATESIIATCLCEPSKRDTYISCRHSEVCGEFNKKEGESVCQIKET